MKDNFDNVVGVLAPNGQDSVLFKNALQYLTDKNNFDNIRSEFSEEEVSSALTIFGSAYTQGFEDFYTDEFFNKNFQTDINGEPVLEDVLTYLKSTENQRMDEVGKIDFEDFKNQFPEMDYETLENKLYDAFLDENGNFVIDENKLRSSNIYESQEVDNILGDSALQELIKKNVLALNKEDFLNISNDNFLNITLGEEYNSFGKLKTFDSTSLLNTILKSTINASTEEEFDTLLNQSVSSNVYDAIIDNEDLYNTIKSMSLNLKEVSIKSFENGSVNDVLERDMFNELKETLILTNIKPETLDSITVLTSIDYDVLLNNINEVTEIANSIEKDLIASNIDVVGLSSKIISENVEKTQSFLRILNNFVSSVGNGYVNDEIIRAFSDIYNDFFNIRNRTDFVDIESFDYDVVKFDNQVSKLDAYNNGYLKIRDSYYIPIENSSYEDVLTSLIDSYEVGENLLEGVIPNNLKSDIAYRNYIDDIVNSRINSFGEEVNEDNIEDFKSIVIMEFLNGVDNNNDYGINEYLQEKENLETKDLNYLTFDFLSDLNNIVLISKLNNSPLYDKIFKYLEFKNGGINIKENKELITTRIQNILPDTNKVIKELKDYFPTPSINEVLDNNSLREAYFTNPESLKFINTGYVIVNDQLITDLTSDDFIRTKEGVFEKVDNIQGKNIYSALVQENGFVRLSSLNKQIKGNNIVENAIKFNNKYSQSRKEEILNEITNCN